MTTDGAAGSGPTARRLVLGSQLRRLREANGISREDAGYSIRGSGSKISRMELGRVGFKERDVADLLTLYGVDDETERATFLEMVRESNQPGWWHRYSDLVPTWFQDYVGLEESASRIQTYEIQFVPGLLQTEDYARAVIESAAPNVRLAEADRRVEVRMLRQRRLTGQDPLRLITVMSESVLWQQIGGPECLKGQLEHIAGLIEAHPETIEIRVVPFEATGHAAVGGSSFLLLDFPSGQLPTVLWHETVTATKLTSAQLAVREHSIALSGAANAALDRADSLELIKKASERL